MGVGNITEKGRVWPISEPRGRTNLSTRAPQKDPPPAGGDGPSPSLWQLSLLHLVALLFSESVRLLLCAMAGLPNPLPDTHLPVVFTYVWPVVGCSGRVYGRHPFLLIFLPSHPRSHPSANPTCLRPKYNSETAFCTVPKNPNHPHRWPDPTSPRPLLPC